MTIVIGVATPEGLVLASDSRTTSMGGSRHHRVASDNMQKVFVVDGIGVATFGDAFIGSDTIAGVMDQFAAQCAPEHTEDVDAFSSALGAFFDARFRKHKELPEGGEFALGFLVAGYDASGIGQIHEISIPGPEVAATGLLTSNGGVVWRGQTAVIRRLIKGVDWDTLGELEAKPSDEVGVALGALEYHLNYPITVQDGVDFAGFLVRTTIDMERFTDGIMAAPGGIPACGGELQLLAVERSQHTWVASLNLAAPSRPGLAEDPAR
jgi:hypothetical protein